jgi:formylglycine-generating enzyme required for sulfatase activity
MRAGNWSLNILFVLIVSVVTQAAAQQVADTDAIAAELAAAKATYQAVVAKARDELLKAFAAEEKKILDSKLDAKETVRRVERLRTEKKAFETDSKLPTLSTMKSAGGKFQLAESQARQKCESAFQTAAEKYGRIDLAKAKAVLTEKATFFTAALAAEPSPAAKTTSKLVPQAGIPSSNPSFSPQGWPANAPKPAIGPFDAAQAKAHQEAWARHLGVPVEYTNTIGMRFRLIPPGEYMRGSTPEEIESALRPFNPKQPDWNAWLEAMNCQGPQHKVVLTRPIYLGTYEVTQKDYQAVMGSNPSFFAKTGTNPEWAARVTGHDTSNYPVENVNWNDAAEFCAKLSRLENRNPFYSRSGESITLLDNGNGYRLPTEAEWEFACRAGNGTTIWKGEDLARVGWVSYRASHTQHVGQLLANPFGLYDVHGNLWEWCSDWYDAKEYLQFAGRTVQDPQGPPKGATRVLRGGSWMSHNSSCWSAYREPQSPDTRGTNLGFRVALVVSVAAGDQSPAAANGSKRSLPGGSVNAPPPAIAPFDAAQAKAHQEAWARHLGVPVEYTNTIGMRFRLVPPGEFSMGTPPDQVDKALASGGVRVAQYLQREQPARRVRISRPLYFAVHETTQREFSRFVEASDYKSDAEQDGKGSQQGFKDQGGQASGDWRTPGYEHTDLHPVVNVSATDAMSFCDWLSRADGIDYRLPREAEWEHACRAGTTTLFHMGDDRQTAAQLANMLGSSDRFQFTAPVGLFPPNPFGMHDMCGNVWEICRDLAAPNYAGHDSAGDPPKDAKGSEGVARGGGADCPPGYCRSAARTFSSRSTRASNLGFRIVCEVTEHFRPPAALCWSNPAPMEANVDLPQTDDHGDVELDLRSSSRLTRDAEFGRASSHSGRTEDPRVANVPVN